MNNTLVVVRPFASHAKGDVIADAAIVAATLAGDHANHVVRVVAATPPPPPAPAPQQGS